MDIYDSLYFLVMLALVVSKNVPVRSCSSSLAFDGVKRDKVRTCCGTLWLALGIIV